MEVSNQFKTTSSSLPSPCATHVAALVGSRLQIRSCHSLEIIRNIPLPASHDWRNARIAWAPRARSAPPGADSTPPRRRQPAIITQRILLSDDETTRVYDLRDAKWSAVINNGSGGMGKNVHAEFGKTEDEVLVWSDFASKVTVWCLNTGRTVEIKDPKFLGRDGKGWGYRSESGENRGSIMACLCRTSGQDVLMLLAPRTYDVLHRVELPTVDAAGIRWSRDGRWIAVWDSAASGYRVHIYTADAQLYRSIYREPIEESNDWGVEGLGVKSLDWVPGDQWLALGGWDRRVRILSTRTFSPVVFLDHTADIHVPSAPVYTEQVDGRGFRSYSLTQQPVSTPKAIADKTDTTLKQGISVLAFNKEGTFCATRDDSAPTTIWIWDLRALRPTTILIQHAPVKSLQWHPEASGALLIQSVQDHPVVYLYSVPSLSESCSATVSQAPEVLDLKDSVQRPATSAPPRWDVKWLATGQDRKPAFIYGHQQGYIVVWPEGKDQILRFENEDGEQSDDSLYDILTGRTPVPPLHQYRDTCGSVGTGADSGNFTGVAAEEQFDQSGFGESTESFEDTFREKRKGRTVTSQQGNAFDESGMSEMF